MIRVHKKVRVASPEDIPPLNDPQSRFGDFNFAVDYEDNKFYEGKYKSKDGGTNFDFVTHHNMKKTVKKRNIYQLGVKAEEENECIAYYNGSDPHLYSGRVLEINANDNKIFVQFDDGDNGWLKGEWYVVYVVHFI